MQGRLFSLAISCARIDVEDVFWMVKDEPFLTGDVGKGVFEVDERGEEVGVTGEDGVEEVEVAGQGVVQEEVEVACEDVAEEVDRGRR